MTTKYQYIDTLFRNNSKYQDLRVTDNSKNILIIFRLLSGTVNCKDLFNNKDYKFKTNFFKFPFENINTRLQYSNITEIYEGISINDINNFFRNTYGHDDFFNSIKIEITHCLISKENRNYFEAFFHLYRIIEGISYTIPLLYISKSNNFKKSFSDLKSFFGNQNNKSELGFFKKFLETLDSYNDLFIDIDLNCIEIEELQTQYYNIYIEKICTPNRINCDATENEELRFSFIDFYRFIINLRNRYFHFLQGSWQENLDNSEIKSINHFFKPFINHGINFVSIIILEIINFQINNNIRN